MVLEGHEAVVAARQVIGATNPLEAAPGSIRGDFALEVGSNMVHGSDSNESAAREVALFFPELADGTAAAAAPPMQPSPGPACRPRLGSPAAAGDPRRSSASRFEVRAAGRRRS